MRKVILVLLGLLPIFSFAGVIMTTNGERIEDVSIQSETSESIVYVENGVEKTISIERVQAVLFDNGNFKEYPKYSSVVVSEPAVSANANVVLSSTEQPMPTSIDLANYDPVAKKCVISGWCLLGGSLAFLTMGLIDYAVVESGFDYACLFGLAPATLAASIPLLSIGYIRRNNVKKQLYTQSVNEQYLFLDLQTSQNGIGFALKF